MAEFGGRETNYFYLPNPQPLHTKSPITLRSPRPSSHSTPFHPRSIFLPQYIRQTRESSCRRNAATGEHRAERTEEKCERSAGDSRREARDARGVISREGEVASAPASRRDGSFERCGDSSRPRARGRRGGARGVEQLDSARALREGGVAARGKGFACVEAEDARPDREESQKPWRWAESGAATVVESAGAPESGGRA